MRFQAALMIEASRSLIRQNDKFLAHNFEHGKEIGTRVSAADSESDYGIPGKWLLASFICELLESVLDR